MGHLLKFYCPNCGLDQIYLITQQEELTTNYVDCVCDYKYFLIVS